jgi:hypothetical protein
MEVEGWILKVLSKFLKTSCKKVRIKNLFKGG